MMLLPSSPARAARARRGLILLWATFAAFAIVAGAVILSTVATSSSRLSESNRDRTSARYMSRAATARAAFTIYDALALGSAPPAEGTVDIGGHEASYTVTLTDGPTLSDASAGLYSMDSVYRIEGFAEAGRAEARTKRIVVARVVPLFQFALYYEEDMEFLYPAPMTINGPVHCNGDIYLYAQHGLNFDTNYMRAVGGVYSRPHFSEWTDVYNWGPNNPAEIRRWVADPLDPVEPVEFVPMETKTQMDSWGIPSVSGFDSDFVGHDAEGDGDYYGPDVWLPFGARSLEQWSNPDLYAGGEGSTLLTGEHGVQRVEAPEIDDFRMYMEAENGDFEWSDGDQEFVEVAPGTGTHAPGPFYAAAGLSIISNPDGTWEAYDHLGLDVTAVLAGAVTSTTMYDARQAQGNGEEIQVTVIDVQSLNSSGLFPSNGLLFVAGHGSGTGTDVKGFQLTNGDTLLDDLSIVSPDSIYVRGDFNSNAVKSAAVMADAVNLLSNGWDNSKQPGTLPSASSTTYRMAILTGDVEATADAFNGGPHNLPRFHENWSGRTCTIVGSMVALGHSEKATGRFEVYGDYYQAPNRNWSFDTRFSAFENLPPFTPTYVSVDDVVVW